MISFNDFRTQVSQDEDDSVLAEKYEKYMREHNPGVKEAWEQYQLMLTLTFNTNNEDFVEHQKQEKEENRLRKESRMQLMNQAMKGYMG